jgi:ATP-binding cassette subfamily B protein
MAEKSTNLVGALQDGLGGVKEIIIGRCQEFYLKFFHLVNADLRIAQATSVFLSGFPRYVVETFGIILIVIFAVFLNFQEGGIIQMIPVLAVFALAAQKLLPIFQQIYSSYATFLATKQSAIDIVKLVENKEKTKNRNQYSILKYIKFKEGINLKNVSFSYDKSQTWILENVNLYIPKGSFVCVVGETGSGKSTLIDIILGLLQPTKGTIELDGKVVVKKDIYNNFQLFSHVPQDVFLLDVSIAENIALGVPVNQIDLKKLHKVSKLAQIHTYIDNLPNKFFTTVGEKGAKLSGGQKQRIAIARALYKNANIIIFDEATSALDTKTEKSLIDTVLVNKNDLTLISITHREEHLLKCDIVLNIINRKVEIKINK